MTPDLGKPNTSNVFLYWRMCYIIGECVSLLENARDLHVEKCRLIEQKDCFQSNLTLLLREIMHMKMIIRRYHLIY